MMNSARLKSRRSRVSVTVDADVDVSIEDVPSEELIAELEERGNLPSMLPKTIEVFPKGTMLDILELLEAGQFKEAQIVVESILRPKWPDSDSCKNQYEAAMRMRGVKEAV